MENTTNHNLDLILVGNILDMSTIEYITKYNECMDAVQGYINWMIVAEWDTDLYGKSYYDVIMDTFIIPKCTILTNLDKKVRDAINKKDTKKCKVYTRLRYNIAMGMIRELDRLI